MRVTRLAPDKWLLDVRHYHGGQERRLRETFTGGRNAATARWHELQKGLRHKARSLETTAGTFAAAVDTYLGNRHLDRTSERYLRDLKQHLGQYRMEEMREAWLRYLPLLRKRQGKFTCRPLTPATINLYLRWAKAAIGASLAPGETNPLTGIQQLPVVPRDRILDASERQKLLAAVEHRAPHLLPMIVFALRVPCRTGELLAMRREWVNLFTMTVDIPSGITKGGLPCSKPIPVELRDYFKGLRYDHVFTMPDGRPIRSFYGPWRNCLKDAGIVNWRLHDCRHQAVSAMAAEGISDRDIMGCAAWSTNMMQVYWHRDAKRSGAEIAARWTQNRTLAPYTSEADVVQMASG